jgi:hypothetical protein
MMNMTMDPHARRKAPPISLIVLALLSARAPAALGAESLSGPLHLAVSAAEKAAAPALLYDYALFTASFAARSVGIVFQHEDFKTIHPMQINRYGVFFLVYPLPVGTDEPLRYRYVVDGAWVRDPLNGESTRDPLTGTTLSVLRYPRISDEKPGVYRILDGRRATFTFRAGPDERVFLSGSFNDWDPFMYPMAEVEPGLYRVSLDLSPGIQRYGFVVEGEILVDPLNPESAFSRDGLRVSVLSVN